MPDEAEASPSAAADGSSAYATGGGGVVLEHTFGATLLAALLLGDPVPGLGDEQSVVKVTFQANQFSPVDDVVIVGEPRGQAGGEGRQLSIGVRRNPKIAPSDKSFVALLGKYLNQVANHWAEIQAGRLRLGLAVAGPHTGAQDLSKLAGFARTQPGNEEFRSAVSAPKATTNAVRSRLELLDRAIVEALRETSVDIPGGAPELAWRLLVGLHVIETRLEGDDATDRTACVARLRDNVTETSEADRLFSELCRLVSRYDPAGASVDEATLRRDLAGVATIRRSPSFHKAWEALDVLEQRLRQNTRRQLTSRAGDALALERSAARDALLTAMKDAATRGVALVVTGEPDVGKSALALAAADRLKAQGEEVVVVSLRDLPPSALDTLRVFGATWHAIFGSMAVSPTRILVVDGAEAALEDRFDVLAELSEFALSAGIGLVAITRSDAAGRVIEALSKSTAGRDSHVEIEIVGLENDEIEQVVATFPLLARLAVEPRSAWLLNRPGLIDILLRADAFASLPDGALSEADVFAAVWHRLVRRPTDNTTGAGTPDGRALALADLARRQLVPAAPSPLADLGALPSLRSDGLLRSLGPTAVWRSGDEFATDLVRDFALAHVFVSDGWAGLTHAGAPRWAIRAARLGCQARYAASPSTVESTRAALQLVFDALASDHGDRWADIPLEALVTLGSPHDALEQAWTDLLRDDGDGLRRLIRLVLQRYADGLTADAILVEPVVQLLLDHASETAISEQIHDSIGELQIKWLRGLAAKGGADTTNPLRLRLRDRILKSQPGRHDEWALECLSLLGADLNDAAEGHLRQLASEAPEFLKPCVEGFVSSVSMAAHRPVLLLDLSEAYYIDEEDRWERGYSGRDDGVRDHQWWGIGAPMVAWHYGPFWQLVNRVPVPALAFINRLLDHGARVRIQKLGDLNSGNMFGAERPMAEQDMPAFEMAWPGIGPGRFVGDGDSWSWYRGSTVGPYPCMSALFAVERFVDHVHTLGIDLRTLVARLLKECHNLAMPGLAFGFLVRHLDEVTDELDPWLSDPMVWELEFRRATSESGFHVQGLDPEDIHGAANRRMLPTDVAIQLAIRAIRTDDEVAKVRLRSVADALVEGASVRYGPATRHGYEQRMELVQSWAAVLRAENYHTETLADATTRLLYTPPQASDEAVSQQTALDRAAQALGLLRYAYEPTRQPHDLTPLNADLCVAIELSDHPSENGQQFASDGFSALGATAIIAFVEGRIEPERKHLEWAVVTVLRAALGTPDAAVFEPSFFNMGGDRSAALAVPCLLLPAFNENDTSWLDEDDLQTVHEALFKLMTSGSEEVRRKTARALGRVWSAPCAPDNAAVRCRHRVALDAIEASVRDCRMGPFDNESQRRRMLPIETPLSDALDSIEPQTVLIDRLTASLFATCMCTLSSCCVSEMAIPLRDALLRLHVRGAVYWIGENYHLDQDPEVQQMVAECLLHLGAAGKMDAVQAYVAASMAEPLAFSQLLQEFARSATYDSTLRTAFGDIWPTIMTQSLGVLEAGRSGAPRRPGRASRQRDWDEPVSALIPNPQLRSNDRDVSSTFAGIHHDWIGIESLEPFIARWMALAGGRPKCVDGMVGYVHTLPIETQSARGLDLVVEVVDGQFEKVASHTSLLVEWLKELRANATLQGTALSKYQLLVDGLATSGDSRAARLQRSLE